MFIYHCLSAEVEAPSGTVYVVSVRVAPPREEWEEGTVLLDDKFDPESAWEIRTHNMDKDKPHGPVRIVCRESMRRALDIGLMVLS